MSDRSEITETLQIGFWIASIFLVLCTIAINIIGWRVNGNKARDLAIKKDTHESIEKTFKSIVEFEDAALSYWLDQESKIRSYQLVILHKRCITNLKQLSHLKNGLIPSVEIREMRRYSTLDSETAVRPIKDEDPRVKKISKAVTTVLDSDLLLKSWRS